MTETDQVDRVHAALKVFALVDESSRGALEHVVLKLIIEAEDKLADSMDKMTETDRWVFRRVRQMLNGEKKP